MAHVFEEIRNVNGVLYKLSGKLSEYKEVNVTIVPKTKLVYMHINDNSKAYKNGSFDKHSAKSVSLSMAEVLTLRNLISATMDSKVTELVNSCQTQGKKRKLAPDDAIAAQDAWLAEFNTYQGNTATTSQLQQTPLAYGTQSTSINYQQQPSLGSDVRASLPSAGDYAHAPTTSNFFGYTDSYQQPIATTYQQPVGSNQQYYAVAQYQQSASSPQATQGRAAQPSTSWQQRNSGYQYEPATTNNPEYHT